MLGMTALSDAISTLYNVISYSFTVLSHPVPWLQQCLCYHLQPVMCLVSEMYAANYALSP